MAGKPTIIAVDDDPQVLRAIGRDLVRRYGEDYRVLRASSGREALGLVDTLTGKDEPIALLLSDQRMPQMDGVSFLSEAKQRLEAKRSEAKRVLITAYADTDAAIAAINRSQVDYYLLKPWDPPEDRLYPILDDLLEDWRANYRPGYGGVKVIGDRWSPDSHQIRDFLARNHVPYMFEDVEASPEARERAAQAGGPDALPLVILPDGDTLAAPAVTELAARVGLRTAATQPFYDLVIVGAGPAGLAAAVYGASEGLRTVMIEESAAGGQAGTSSLIENYLGFPRGLSGADLARRALDQARKFEVEILTPQQVVGLGLEGQYKKTLLADGSEIVSHVLCLTMGLSWRKLDVPGADRFTGRGIYYGAALTEAKACQDKDVYIVGAGNSAGQAALYFARHARKVVMLVRGDSLGARMSQYLVDRIGKTPNIEVRLRSRLSACEGDGRLHAIRIEDDAGAVEERDANYLFSFIGAAPRTDWLGDCVARDERGFILTGPDLKAEHLTHWPLERQPFLLETNVPGAFAAGDVRHQSIKRVASAVGEGSVTVHFIHQYLASL